MDLQPTQTLVVPHACENFRLRLVCFPHSGGGPSYFAPWAELLAKQRVELVAVILPGREKRFGEEPYTHWEQVVGDVCEALENSGLVNDVPYAFFGHSLGALMALETARRLDEQLAAARPRPVHVFASGHGPPATVLESAVSMDDWGHLHTLSDDRLLEAVSSFGVLPKDVLGQQKFVEAVLPALRADLQVYETYRAPQGRAPLPVPITALGGNEDPLASLNQLQGWAAETSRGLLGPEVFPGDHFYTDKNREEVLSLVVERLKGALDGLPRSLLRSELEVPAVCTERQIQSVILEDAAVAHSTSEAMVDETERITYGVMAERVDLLASKLQAEYLHGEANRVVAVLMPHDANYVVCMLAIWKATATVIVIEAHFPPELCKELCEESKTVAAMATKQYAPKFADVGGCKTLVMERGCWDGALEPPTSPVTFPSNGMEDLAVLMMTSGTTGKPKTIAGTHIFMHLGTVAKKVYAPYAEDDRREGFNVMFVWEVMRPLMFGYPSLLIPDSAVLDPSLFVASLQKHRCSRVLTTPSLLASVMQHSSNNIHNRLAGMRVWFTCGEVLPMKTVRIFRELLPHVKLINDYSTWEAGDISYATVAPQLSFEPSQVFAAAGHAAPAACIAILDAETKQACPVGVPGELYIGGIQVSNGYHSHPGMTAERFVSAPLPEMEQACPGTRWYKSGDLGRLVGSPPALEIRGRMDSTVKIRGFKVGMAVVEGTIMEVHGVAQCAVVPLYETPAAVDSLLCFLKGSEGHDFRELVPKVKQEVSQKLPPVFVPAFFKEMPTAVSGGESRKLDRKKMAKMYDLASLRAAQAAEQAAQEGEEEVDVRLEEGVRGIVKSVWAKTLHLSLQSLDLQENFFDLGGHSMLASRIANELSEGYGISVTVLDIYTNSTLGALLDFLDGQGRSGGTPGGRQRSRRALPRSPGQGAPEIAVVGLAGRFPGAVDADAFWQNLVAGAVSMTTFSKEYLMSKGVPEPVLAHKDFVPGAYMINDADKFDHQFFGINRNEAAHMDPQHRVFIETTWAALDNAALPPRTGLSDTVVGVFAAAGIDGYLVHHLDGKPLKDTMEPGDIFLAEIGNEKDYIATRVSYLLDFTGPSMNVNSACSSALVACVQGASAIYAGQCDAAVAGASSITFPNLGYLYQDGLVASTDGYVRPFDAKAEGTVFGDAVGSVVLRRTDDVGGGLAWGALRGFSVTNDGGQKAGYAAPSPAGQREAIVNALEMSGLDPWSLSYVECHCTGTKVGDGIEIRGLLDAFSRAGGDRPAAEGQHGVALGSVKGNIAHANCAAGVTGLIKVLYMLRSQQLVPVANFEKLNPKIDLSGSPFFVNNEACSWDGRNNTLRTGVSSFGIGGTNAHTVLEEIPQAPPHQQHAGAQWSYHVLPLSAKSVGALRRGAAAVGGALGRESGPLRDAAYTLQVGRSELPLRKALVVAESADRTPRALTELDDEHFPTEEELEEQEEATKQPAVAFLFPGQGSQYLGMARGLYEQVPLFQATLDRCCELLSSPDNLGFDPRAALLSPNTTEAEFARPTVLQPSLFAVEYALSQVYDAVGVKPAAVAGHSLGEYTAAVTGGLLALESAVAIVAARARSTETLAETGAMLSVAEWSEEELGAVERGERPGLWLAAANSPVHAVVSGETAAVDALHADLERTGRKSTKLRIDKAFHSGLIAKAADTLQGLGEPKEGAGSPLPVASNLTGGWLSAAQLRDGDYWVKHMRGTVRWRENAEKLLSQWRPAAVLEVGPMNMLSTLTKKCVAAGGVVPEFVQAMRHPKSATHDVAAFLQSLARLWELGCSVDWPALHTTVLGTPERSPPRQLRLPAYSFEPTSLWVNPESSPYVDKCDDPMPAGCVRGASPVPAAAAQAPPPRALVRFGDHRDREPQIRAYCLPFASGSATVFAPWAAVQDDAVEVVAVELPGRGGRSEEAMPGNDEEDSKMIEALSAAILADVGGAQYVLVGFSMGAGLCVELALSLAAKQAPLPLAIYTAGRKPPAEDPETITDITVNMTNEELAGYAFTAPEVARTAEFAEFTVPMLRADLGLDARTERRLSAMCKAGAKLPQGVGLEVSCGTSDDVAPFAQAPGWQRFAHEPPGVHYYPGGHEFMMEQRPMLRASWRKDAVGRVAQRRVMEAAILAMQGTSAPALPGSSLGGLGSAAPEKKEEGLPLYAVRWVEAGPAGGAASAPAHFFVDLGEGITAACLEGALAAMRGGSMVLAACAPAVGVFSGQGGNMEVAQCWRFLQLVQHLLLQGAAGRLAVVCPAAASGAMVAGASKAVAMEVEELRVQRLFVPAGLLPGVRGRAGALCGLGLRHASETDVWVQDDGLEGPAFVPRLDNMLAPSPKLPCVPQRAPDGQLASYVLTGATGGLGQMVLRWLIKDQGLQPHQLVLLRRAGSAPLGGELAGCTTVEVASVDSLEGLMASPLRDLKNVLGIFHLAGVLDDGIISGMTEERVRAVAKPKCGMMVALLRAAAAMRWPTRWLLGFSSTSSLFGYAGQANYCAANALLDQLSSFGAAGALPQGDEPPCRVVTINWGPWAEAGMAKEGTKAYEAAVAEGDTPLPTAAALGCLAAALRSAGQAQPAATQFCACDVQWQKSQWRDLPILDLVWERPADTAPVGGDAGAKAAEVSEGGATPQKRVEDFLVSSTRSNGSWKRIQGKTLHQLGLDSLEVVQLRNMFNKKFGVTVPLGVVADSTQKLSDLGAALGKYLG